MKRIVLWLLSTLTVVVLLFGYHTSTSGAFAENALAPTTVGPGSSGSGNAGDTGNSSGSTGSTGSTGSGKGGSSSADSTTATGSVAQTRWGPVQVEITAQSKKITDVNVLQYPDDNPKDQQINAYALPILVDETLQAQSADIDMVSGATVTSYGYVESLQAALDKAGL